jgi:hypothetical protein
MFERIPLHVSWEKAYLARRHFCYVDGDKQGRIQ